MKINNAINKIEEYDNSINSIINFLDNKEFEKEIISKTYDFLKKNFDIQNIYICEKHNSFIILKNSKSNPIFKINADKAKPENLPFTITSISHPLQVKHNCPFESKEGIPSICLPIKKFMHEGNNESYLNIQFKKYPKIKEEDIISLSHITLTLQKTYQYHNKLLQFKNKYNYINREFEQFIHFVSHDLKSPITAILGFIAIINDENINKYSENLRHYLERISINARVIEKMINDISYVSRLKKTDEEIIDPNKLLAECMVPLQPSIKYRNINLIVDKNLPEIYVNRSHILKLFQLILKNSIEFTKENGWIKIGYKNNEFYVSDNGLGIKGNNLEKVFRIFYTTCEKRDVHTGTGLYIAKKIVELYDGNIRIESEYGKGTTVFFTLPLAKE